MNRPEITWWRNRFRNTSSAAGWHAIVDGKIVGIVFADGDVSLGDGSAELISTGSQHLAALAVVRYVEAGAR